eukprot:CAMPEP_0197532486 /NCGR_PEP_ID=MMETSP1318-20131121/39893_1 /TAXON_ID=552666 /ORGANISM="Partenskyella glossopodia, Strain RCC365" /LENGTH=171 /DNA_ID=CAMNT_0043089057 /DNA_START=476 /DNA_END=991 /DNA_ORIENTATION=+
MSCVPLLGVDFEHDDHHDHHDGHHGDHHDDDDARDNKRRRRNSRGNKNVVLRLGALDVVDGTPVIDIKPYIKYSDCIPDAKDGCYHDPKKDSLPVEFVPSALEKLEGDLMKRAVIEEALGQDPRPSYKKSHSDDPDDSVDRKEYCAELFDFNVRFTVGKHSVLVRSIDDKK